MFPTSNYLHPAKPTKKSPNAELIVFVDIKAKPEKKLD
jgi:hypothetical protein